MLKYDLEGKDCVQVAAGLRNDGDFIQYDGKIFAPDTGKDGLGMICHRMN